MKTLYLVPLLLLTGCATVPRTEISFNPTNQTVAIKSPKDIAIKGLKIELVSGAANITIESYTSKNNYEVVKAVTEANAAALKDLSDKGAALIGNAISATK